MYSIIYLSWRPSAAFSFLRTVVRNACIHPHKYKQLKHIEDKTIYIADMCIHGDQKDEWKNSTVV